MVSIGNDIDRDADSTGHHQLGPRAMYGFDQPPAEFSCVLKVKCDQARRRMALIEGVDRFDEDCSSVRQKQKLADRFAGRKKKGPLIKVDLDFVFWLELRDNPRGGVDSHDLRELVVQLVLKSYGLQSPRATLDRPHPLCSGEHALTI